MTRLSRVAAVTWLMAATLLLASCSLFSTPVAAKSDLVGTWKADRFDAAIVLRDDMTFTAQSVPAGYVYIDVPDGADAAEPLTFSGTWEARAPFQGYEYHSLLLEFELNGSSAYKYLDERFRGGRLSELYLIQGDPDNGDYLSFFVDSAETG